MSTSSDKAKAILRTMITSTMYITLLFLFLGLLTPTFGGPSHPVSYSEFANLSNPVLSTLFADYDKPIAITSAGERRWANGVLPNPATNQAWETAKCKGRRFMAQMF